MTVAVARFRRLHRPGLTAALLALAGQLAWAATVPQPVLLLLGFGPICHAGPHHGPIRGKLPPARAVPAVCQALAMPVALPATPLPLPPSRGTAFRMAARLPFAMAPPRLFALAAAPRGPPPIA